MQNGLTFHFPNLTFNVILGHRQQFVDDEMFLLTDGQKKTTAQKAQAVGSFFKKMNVSVKGKCFLLIHL